ncbi:MAG: Ig-like domain-containing protein, partial [Lachnospiraceae bacterium]|nr:Ig-like domain-containing protein [Lachnospiraceae bacterium]
MKNYKIRKYLTGFLTAAMLFGTVGQNVVMADEVSAESSTAAEAVQEEAPEQTSEIESIAEAAMNDESTPAVQEETVQEGAVQNETEEEAAANEEISEIESDDAVSMMADSFSPYMLFQSEGLMAAPAAAPASESEAKKIDVVISDFTLESRTNTDGIHQEDQVELRFHWDASSYGTNIHENDYFTIDLPEQLIYNSGSVTIGSFDLANEDGVVFGRAVVDRDAGTVTATFNSNVEEKYDVKGTMHFRARVSNSLTTPGEENTFTLRAGTVITSVTYMIHEKIGGSPADEAIWKTGGHITWTEASSIDNITQANWNIHVKNDTGTAFQNVVITDHLSGKNDDPTDETYIENSFRISPVAYYEGYSPRFDGDRAYIDVSEYVQLSADKQSFVFNLPEQYNSTSFIFEYRTTYNNAAGKDLKNSAEFTSTTTTKEMSIRVRSVSGGGTADATIANRIRLVKVDEEDSSVRLSGAEFIVTKPDGSTFTMVTGADGTVTSPVLVQGDY